MTDTEKLTLNLGVVDLGQIDLLIEQGFYANRADFLRAAVRHELLRHESTSRETISRFSATLGVLAYTRKDLEALYDKGQRLRITVVGMLVIGSEVTPELAVATFERATVYGVLRASDEVRAALITSGALNIEKRKRG